MKTKETIFAIISLTFLLASCEDVIDVELDSIPPRMVIEGVINDMDQQCQIKLSKTSDYFKPGENPAVTGATVSVTDENGNTAEFEETAPGTFTSQNMLGIESFSYTLQVWAEEENYMADCTLPQKVHIDSLSFGIPPMLFEFEDGFMVTCYFQDPGEVRNYYRMKAYKKDDVLAGDQSKVVFNDDFMDGNEMIMPWDLNSFQPLDTVVVELQTLDQATYDYYRTLFPILGGGFGASNPANPETNLTNDALGYFGAYTICRDTIIISSN